MYDSENKWGIVPLQEKILEVAMFIHNTCIDNNIEYFLMGGSALGAIRHDGFIPWDDDLDVFMTPSNYNKFRDLFLKNENKMIGKYHLQEYGVCDSMITVAKIRDCSTTLIENGMESWNIQHGVFVDIFILHNAAPTLRKIKKQLFWSRYLVAKGLAIRSYKPKSFKQQLILAMCKITPKRFLLKTALKNIYKYDSLQNSKYVFHFLGRAGLKKGLYDSKIFEHPILHKFENQMLFVPNNLEKYVIERWGNNYMTPPDFDSIKKMQHPSFWDVNQSYTKYLKNVNVKKTEDKLII